MRIDLLTSPGCPGCPAAREAVAAFAAVRPGVEIHEWDLTRDPGPADGRGVFATPAVIVDGRQILIGIPNEEDLMREAGRRDDAGEEPGATGSGATEEIFAAIEKKYGFVPNLIREMAKSPAVARVYLGGQDAMTAASLPARDQQVVQLAVSVYNECEYCRAAHRVGAKMAGIAPADIGAIENGDLAQEPRVRALAAAAWLVLDMRGWLTAADLASLESGGIDRAQLYEIVALVGLKTISNYVNHIAHTAIDGPFRG